MNLGLILSAASPVATGLLILIAVFVASRKRKDAVERATPLRVIPKLEIKRATWGNAISRKDVTELLSKRVRDGMAFFVNVDAFGGIDPAEGDNKKYVEVEYSFGDAAPVVMQRYQGTWIVIPEDRWLVQQVNENFKKYSDTVQDLKAAQGRERDANTYRMQTEAELAEYKKKLEGEGNQKNSTPGTATVKPTNGNDKILTLIECFRSDFPEQFKSQSEWTLRDMDGKDVLKVQSQVYLDFSSRTKFIGFFIPFSDKSFEAVIIFEKEVRAILDRLTAAMTIQVSQLGNKTESKDLTFSGRVFIYHETFFDFREKAIIDSLYKQDGMAVEFRGTDYLVLRIGALDRERAASGAL